ncbi:Serine/Threonine kinase domain protein (macronuclear) [Tetrahymena thermophila SB210]|uniref:Serine/Threonine kinase domain protein n=1 Tax=Tetrahymena thermophila (strain SB210) TaxID=312017 RepID=I7MED2_TETTS|nr:Serine/Threonine kinase domain protein [Tetrahymena thermophila SB210]EAR96109.2 Serine/Threonine kinase domain protein [Tetrahymena thermophila SB210]|eukprot:XP_001016354.2 Serine/Threonine kinase domain protein [Tetrahymena thermophila SB210]
MQQQIQNIIGKQEYKVLGLISQGLSKQTYLVEGEKSKERFSMKVFREQNADSTQSKIYYEKEIKFINDCINQKIQHHENILNFIDFIPKPESNENFLIQEYCEAGSLFNYILNQKSMAQIIQIQICLQIAKGLQWLHSQDIIHRDLKPDSILFTKRNGNHVFKITDFGYSCIGQNQLQSIIGTINYIAPEILSQQSYSKTVDIWALGLTMYEIAYRKQLFQQKTVQQTAQMILSFKCLDDHGHSQNDLFQVIKECLNPDTEARIKIDQVVEILQRMYENQILLAKQKNVQMRDSQVDDISEFNSQFSQYKNEIDNQNNLEQESKIINHQITIQEFQQFIKKFGFAIEVSPQQKGFLKKLLQSKIAPFKMNVDHFSLVCNDKQKFYCNLFHFITCGKLLGCLQQHYRISGQLFQENYADSFQEWVMKLIEESSEVDKSIKKDQFKTLYLALSQIANVRDIYFRLNTYLNWLEDDSYLQQSIKLAEIMYERMQQQESKNFLPATQIQIIKQDYTSGLILSCQGGLYDCFIFEEGHQQTIIMQAAYLNAIQCIEWQSQQQQKEIQDLIFKFKKTIINQGILKETKLLYDRFKKRTIEFIDKQEKDNNDQIYY